MQQIWEKGLSGDKDLGLFLSRHTFVHAFPSCVMHVAKEKLSNFNASSDCKYLQERVVALIILSDSVETAGVIFELATKLFFPKFKNAEVAYAQSFLSHMADMEAINLNSFNCNAAYVDTLESVECLDVQNVPYYIYFNEIFEKNISFNIAAEGCENQFQSLQF